MTRKTTKTYSYKKWLKCPCGKFIQQIHVTSNYQPEGICAACGRDLTEFTRVIAREVVIKTLETRRTWWGRKRDVVINIETKFEERPDYTKAQICLEGGEENQC